MADNTGSASEVDQATSKASEKSGRDRRTFVGQIVNPKKQFKYAFFFIGSGGVVLTLFIAITLFFIHQTISALQIAYNLDADVVATLNESLTGMLSLALLVAIVFTILSLLFGLQTTHRFYGPQVSLLRQIEELKNGNFSARVHLRKADELTDIQDALNGLAEALEKKYPKA
jgi:methyl-accepting chemotaxis protein